MTLALIISFAVAAVGFVARTLAITVDAYPQLPQEVPYHFDAYGNADSYGSKPMIFMMVIGQAIAIGVFAIVASVILLVPSSPTPIFSVGLSVCGVCLGLFDAQRSILDVALGKTERLANQWRPLWIILPCVVIGVTIGAIFGR